VTVEIEIIGVVGAGVMGKGVAQCAAEAGFSVILVDSDPEVLATARAKIRDGVRLGRLLGARGGEDSARVIDRIAVSGDVASLAPAGLVIECVPERWETKQAVFRAIDATAPPAAILASTTSAIPIARLAAVTSRPPEVLGLHFMNPAPQKHVVELVRSPRTSDATIERAVAVLRRMGKEAIVVRDGPGFVINRVLMLAINEAAFLVAEGAAPAADVDRLMTSCLGHAMGPLATADLIGLDVVLHTLEVLREGENAVKYRPCPLLVDLVKKGRLGRKSGHGFFAYPAGPSA
jgi:3-hydroxybutyryl-CoA dehydrogenase